MQVEDLQVTRQGRRIWEKHVDIVDVSEELVRSDASGHSISLGALRTAPDGQRTHVLEVANVVIERFVRPSIVEVDHASSNVSEGAPLCHLLLSIFRSLHRSHSNNFSRKILQSSEFVSIYLVYGVVVTRKRKSRNLNKRFNELQRLRGHAHHSQIFQMRELRKERKHRAINHHTLQFSLARKVKHEMRLENLDLLKSTASQDFINEGLEGHQVDILRDGSFREIQTWESACGENRCGTKKKKKKRLNFATPPGNVIQRLPRDSV